MAGGKFRKQFSVGNYILDFYSPEFKLGVEADGGQHHEDKGKEKDEVRARELSKLGVEILRFNDNEILANIDGVCEVIQKALSGKIEPPHLSPLPYGERR